MEDHIDPQGPRVFELEMASVGVCVCCRVSVSTQSLCLGFCLAQNGLVAGGAPWHHQHNTSMHTTRGECEVYCIVLFL